MSALAIAPCSLVPQPTTRIGDLALAASRSRPASSAADDEGCASRLRSRSASAGSAAIMSVITNGGPSRIGGIEDSSQGSGAPGSGALGIEGGRGRVGHRCLRQMSPGKNRRVRSR